MRALLRSAARAALGVLLFLLVLAVLRWEPVHACPPWPVRALPLAGPALLAAVAVALTARPRGRGPVRALALALLACTGALALVVAAGRGGSGLVGEATDPRGTRVQFGPGPIAVSGADLHEMPAAHKIAVRWAGALHAPASGTYRLWATGRGTLDVRVDGQRVLSGDGDPLVAGGEVLLSAGPHALEVEIRRTGPGVRLELGWARPQRNGRPGGYVEPLGPRYLGDPHPVGWWLTDALALAVAVLLGALVLAVPWDVPAPAEEAAPPPVSRRELLLSAAGQALVLAVMSWPLVTHPAGLGVMDRPDGRLNAWILAWDVHALLHEPARLFQAPVFHPLPDALAFSENLLVPAVLSAPAQLGGPVLAYNVALLLCLLVSGLGVHLLVRRVGKDPFAAFVAGALFAAGPHRWIRLAHLHAQATLFLPFVLLALDRFRERPHWRRGMLVGLLLGLQALSSVYLAAITALVVAVAVVVGVAGGWRARELLALAAGAVVAAVLTAPVAAPYLRMRAFEGMEWTLEDVRTYATTLESYAAAGTRLYGGLTQRHLDPERVQDTLFPGLVLLAAGLAGLARAPRRFQAVAVLASAVAVVVSLGPETAFYRFLHEHVLFVRGVRALSRFSLVPVLALCVLAGLALAGRRRLAGLALGLALLESSNVPIRYAPAPAPSAAALWLAGRPGAVVVLPLGEDDTAVMLDGLAHLRPLVNGDSGFVPRPYTRAMELLADPPGEEALRFLRAVGVTQVVARERLSLPLAAELGDERIHDVPAGEAARVVAGGTALPERSTPAGPVLDLGARRLVRRLTFEQTDAPWVARPRTAVSDDGATWRDVPARASLADATLSLYADPRHGRGALDLAAEPARFVRLDPRLPARPGTLAFDEAGGAATIEGSQGGRP